MMPAMNNVHTQRESAIQHLIEQTERPREEIEPMFDEEFRAIEEQARIKQFLTLIATRHVVRRLHAH